MTVELVLILGLYGFLIIGAFLGDLGPIETFKKSAPRLAARVERNIAVGNGFRNSDDNGGINWVKPDGPSGGN